MFKWPNIEKYSCDLVKFLPTNFGNVAVSAKVVAVIVSDYKTR